MSWFIIIKIWDRNFYWFCKRLCTYLVQIRKHLFKRITYIWFRISYKYFWFKILLFLFTLLPNWLLTHLISVMPNWINFLNHFKINFKPHIFFRVQILNVFQRYNQVLFPLNFLTIKPHFINIFNFLLFIFLFI